MEEDQARREAAKPLHAEIDQLARLEDDWNSYGGKPPAREVIAWAKMFVSQRPYYVVGVIPLANGGIVIEWEKNYVQHGQYTIWFEPEDLPMVTVYRHKGIDKKCTVQEALERLDTYLQT